MSQPVPESASPSPVDGDGVRVVQRQSAPGSVWTLGLTLLPAILLLAALGWLWWPLSTPTRAAPPSVTAAGAAADDLQGTASQAVRAEPLTTAPAAQPAMTGMPAPSPTPVPTRDPNDLASYVRPGDPEPTAAELIEALREAGEHEGIAAFNPPGTSPPLPGLAVPVDFVLPPGYVRHHQVTDQGEPIEAILMFAPGHVMYDHKGQPIPLPDDLVVPPELAPPGLPIRQVEIPPP